MSGSIHDDFDRAESNGGGGATWAKDSDGYRKEWAIKANRQPKDVYIPEALRDKEPEQLRLPFEEGWQERAEASIKAAAREYAAPYVTGFSVLKDRQGNWIVHTDGLPTERRPSDDEVRQGANEVVEFTRLTRLLAFLR